MKKIIIAMAAVAATFSMASCNKEQPVSPNDNPTVGKSVITASIENDFTKTTLEGNDDEGYKVFWSAGDDLFVGGVDEEGAYNSWIARYTLEESSAGSSQGTFSWQTGQFFYNIIAESSEGAPEFVAGNMYMALHPFDLINTDTGTYIWRTEQTYSESAGYIPMVGAAECTEDGKADFVFTNLGGLLRVTVKGTATIQCITVQAHEPMSGEIAAVIDDDEGNMVALMLDETEEGAFDTNKYVTLDCGDGVDLSSEGTDFYISIPCHYAIDGTDMILEDYSDVTITLTDTDGKTCVKKLNNENGLVIERSKITTATFTASEFKTNVPEGALPGKFTINEEGDQVYFSKGNLFCTDNGEDSTPRYAFAFEDQQYYFRTRFNMDGEMANLAGGVVNTPQNTSGLFQWVSEHAPGMTDDILACFGAFSLLSDDECKHLADDSVEFGNAMGKPWSTLKFEEWAYLIGFDCEQEQMTVDAGRPNATKLFNGWVSVNGVNGAILAPDNWDTETYPIVGEGSPSSYDSSAWAELETKGLVFLPAAGYVNNYHGKVLGAGEYGAYWSKSAYDYSFAYILDFYVEDTIIFTLKSQDGASVRLVCR